MLQALVKNPYRSYLPDLDKFFDLPSISRTAGLAGQVNMETIDTEYLIDVVVPGFTKDELLVDLNDGILRIAGEHKAESKDYARQEYFKQEFERRFSMPIDISGKVEARLENGLLKIQVGRKQPAKPKNTTVEIQ